MAFEYQYGEDRLPIGPNGELAPQELSNAYLQNLDKIMARQEAQQLERTQGAMENQGFFRSGDTLKAVSEQVLGPAQERRNQVLLPEMQRIAEAGRSERMGEVDFQRQRELARQGQLYKLEEMEKQAQINRMLMELEADLRPQQDTDWLGLIAGQAIGGIAGGLTGGLFGGIGGKIATNMFSNVAATGGQSMVQKISSEGRGGNYGW